MSSEGKITAHGKLDIFPKSSPFMKLAILPKKIPIGAAQHIMSVNLKNSFFVILENIKVAIIGVGNCASSFLQGIVHYSNSENEDGLISDVIYLI